MGFREYDILDCPTCGDHTISVIRFPSATSVKKNKSASLPGQGSFHRSKEELIFQSGCATCGLSKEEAEKFYMNPPEMPRKTHPIALIEHKQETGKNGN